jgi:hypothetical protein
MFDGQTPDMLAMKCAWVFHRNKPGNTGVENVYDTGALLPLIRVAHAEPNVTFAQHCVAMML